MQKSIALTFILLRNTEPKGLCKMFYNLHGLPTIIFRYFNVYGPREPLKGVYAPVVGLFLKKLHQNKEITIVGDGLQTRDFTHVGDVVKANIKAAVTSDEKCFGEVFNVGSGTNTSVLELAKRIIAQSPSPLSLLAREKLKIR